MVLTGVAACIFGLRHHHLNLREKPHPPQPWNGGIYAVGAQNLEPYCAMGIFRPGWFSLSVRNDKSQYRAHTWVRPYVWVDLRVYPLPTVEPWAHELCPIMRGKYDHS
jgi:hypothetical protein